MFYKLPEQKNISTISGMTQKEHSIFNAQIKAYIKNGIIPTREPLGSASSQPSTQSPQSSGQSPTMRSETTNQALTLNSKLNSFASSQSSAPLDTIASAMRRKKRVSLAVEILSWQRFPKNKVELEATDYSTDNMNFVIWDCGIADVDTGVFFYIDSVIFIKSQRGKAGIEGKVANGGNGCRILEANDHLSDNLLRRKNNPDGIMQSFTSQSSVDQSNGDFSPHNNKRFLEYSDSGYTKRKALESVGEVGIENSKFQYRTDETAESRRYDKLFQLVSGFDQSEAVPITRLLEILPRKPRSFQICGYIKRYSIFNDQDQLEFMIALEDNDTGDTVNLSYKGEMALRFLRISINSELNDDVRKLVHYRLHLIVGTFLETLVKVESTRDREYTILEYKGYGAVMKT